MMLKILVVDDEPEIVNALKGFFVKKGYEVYVAGDGSAALDLVKKHRPHLVFLDIRMPKVDGLKVLRNIRQMDTSIKVIMVTAFGTQEVIKEAGRIGAVDFICKPFTLNYLEHDVMAKVSVQLFDDLRQEMDGKVKLISQLENLNGRVSRNFYQTMLSLAAALESRDRYTHGHSERVDHYSKLIAQELKTNPKLKMDNKFLEDLHMESRLHDIGKIAVPDEILNKPGKL
ncbi:MAG: response regulator, partial [Candidatus Omnitrophota bacterium]